MSACEAGILEPCSNPSSRKHIAASHPQYIGCLFHLPFCITPMNRQERGHRTPSSLELTLDSELGGCLRLPDSEGDDARVLAGDVHQHQEVCPAEALKHGSG